MIQADRPTLSDESMFSYTWIDLSEQLVFTNPSIVACLWIYMCPVSPGSKTTGVCLHQTASCVQCDAVVWEQAGGGQSQGQLLLLLLPPSLSPNLLTSEPYVLSPPPFSPPPLQRLSNTEKRTRQYFGPAASVLTHITVVLL